jgi:hypothetical protein
MNLRAFPSSSGNRNSHTAVNQQPQDILYAFSQSTSNNNVNPNVPTYRNAIDPRLLIQRIEEAVEPISPQVDEITERKNPPSGQTFNQSVQYADKRKRERENEAKGRDKVKTASLLASGNLAKHSPEFLEFLDELVDPMFKQKLKPPIETEKPKLHQADAVARTALCTEYVKITSMSVIS